MTLFANDFIAAAATVFVALAVLIGVVCGFVFAAYRGVRDLRSASPTLRTRGGVLLALCFAAPLACYFGPRQCFRLTYGRYPLDGQPATAITNGTTRNQVAAILGPPHESHARTDGSETWLYWLDPYTSGYLQVQFGADGRVTDSFRD